MRFFQNKTPLFVRFGYAISFVAELLPAERAVEFFEAAESAVGLPSIKGLKAKSTVGFF